MAIDFFQQQDDARRRTGRLVLLFGLALLCMIALIYGLALVAFGVADPETPFSWWQPQLLLLVAAGVGLLVGGASLTKIAQLASGGQSVALMMGGVEVVGTTTDPHERRLLNVVEEIAIASGVPVPPVYILEEPGINAFAAGYAPGDAVVAVSRGSLTYLNRDELQGVVAHEFSHILNGDMRLNIRLIGLIFGIVVLTIVGRILMNSASRGPRSSSDRNDSRGGIVMLGIGLFVLGLVGSFFGRLIQAAVSRQREYLADASAVQFTRNPDGIAGALKKIGGLQAGSLIQNPRAGEVGHMFFANGLSINLAGLLATHPPLAERIKALDPQFDGRYPEARPVGVDRAEFHGPRRIPGKPTGGLPTLPGLPQVPLPTLGAIADEAAAKVGRLTPEEIHYAEGLHEEMPELLLAAAQEPFGARALIYALLLDPRDDLRELQLAQLHAGSDPRDVTATMRLAASVQALPDTQRLPLVDLSMPALRQMSPRQHHEFRTQVRALMAVDQHLSLFEYTLSCALLRHLDAQFRPEGQQQPASYSAQEMTDALLMVLSMLAWEDQAPPEAAAKSFAAGTASFFGGGSAHHLAARDDCTVAEFDRALNILGGAKPKTKRRIIAACVACILVDQTVTVRETELLRAICDMLDCPMPPLAIRDV